MRTRAILSIVVATTFLGVASETGMVTSGDTTALCKEIKYLENKRLPNNKNADITLLKMANLAQKIHIEPKMFKSNKAYQNICHLRIVKSENFGDFVAYDGYHYKQILKKYPQSNLLDDAAYGLIYVIEGDVYNYADLNSEKAKLEAFVKKYPKSNKTKEAKQKINEIEDRLKNGGQAIYD